MADSAFGYAMSDPTQLMNTIKEQRSARTMQSLGISKISEINKR